MLHKNQAATECVLPCLAALDARDREGLFTAARVKFAKPVRLRAGAHRVAEMKVIVTAMLRCGEDPDYLSMKTKKKVKKKAL